MPTGISGLSILVVDRHFGHIIHDEGLQPAGLRSLGKYLEHKKPHTMSHRQDQRVACYEHSVRVSGAELLRHGNLKAVSLPDSDQLAPLYKLLQTLQPYRRSASVVQAMRPGLRSHAPFRSYYWPDLTIFCRRVFTLPNQTPLVVDNPSQGIEPSPPCETRYLSLAHQCSVRRPRYISNHSIKSQTLLFPST